MLNLGIACINKNHLLSALSRPDLKKYFVKSMTLPNEIQNDVVAAHKCGAKKTPPKRGFISDFKAISPAAETEPAVEPGSLSPARSYPPAVRSAL